jgi:hypothetical protein
VIPTTTRDDARPDAATHPSGVVELDDEDLANIDGAGSSIACVTLVIATVTQCFGNTAIWGSCELGTRGCCR